MRISKDDVADSKAGVDNMMKDMVKDKGKKMIIDKIYAADGAYDNITLYRLLEDNGIRDIVIKPRMNARDDSASII